MDLADLHPASVDARGSTPYFGARRTAPPSSSRRSAPTSAAPTCSSACPVGQAAGTSATSARSPRCAAPSSTRPSSRWPAPTWGAARRACARLRRGRAERLRARLRGDRGPVARPGRARARSPTRCSRGIWARWRSCGAHASPTVTSGWPTSSSPPTAQVWMIDFGFSELAASDLLLATDVAELVTSLSLKVGPERAVARAQAAVGRGALNAGAPSLRPEVPERGDTYGDQGGPAAARRLRAPHRAGGGLLKRRQALAVAGVGAAAFAVSAKLAVDDEARRWSRGCSMRSTGSRMALPGALGADAAGQPGRRCRRRPRGRAARQASERGGRGGRRVRAQVGGRAGAPRQADRRPGGTATAGNLADRCHLPGDVPVEGHSFPRAM